MCSTEVEVEVKFANQHIHPAQLHLSAQGYHLQITAAGGNTEYFPSETWLHVKRAAVSEGSPHNDVPYDILHQFNLGSTPQSEQRSIEIPFILKKTVVKAANPQRREKTVSLLKSRTQTFEKGELGGVREQIQY